jgi:hypothetical protein
VLEYYFLLRSVVRAKPGLRACLKRCRHCGIFFLADPRNAGRSDLGCPFGCRHAHRRQTSTRRSVAYYRDPVGKTKKQALNGKRRPPRRAAEPLPAPAESQSGPGAGRPEWSGVLVAHVRMVCSWLEGRRVSRPEVLAMLVKVLRQHRLCRRRKIDQTVAWLREHPP